MNYCLDTCLLIDAQRELRRGFGSALRFLEQHAADRFWISAVAWGEFVEGRTAENERALSEIRNTVDLLPVTEKVAEVYAAIVKTLRRRGELIPTNDLWIAAMAMEANFELVTRNAAEFGRIAGLKLARY